jgi:hypothetical protein
LCYHKLLEPIKADILAAYKTALWFYRFPSIGYALLSLPPFGQALMKGYALGLTLSKIKSSFFKQY